MRNVQLHRFMAVGCYLFHLLESTDISVDCKNDYKFNESIH
jgi:hypothetical protein